MPSATGLWYKGCCLFLALLCSSICFQGTDSAAKLLPSISSSLIYRPSLGQKFNVSCEGYTTYPSSGIIYWLANKTFVDDLYSDDAVSEKGTVEKPDSTGLSLKRELVFHSFTLKDSCTKFECIILDSAGLARKAITWETPDPSKSGSGAAEPSAVRDKRPKEGMGENAMKMKKA